MSSVAAPWPRRVDDGEREREREKKNKERERERERESEREKERERAGREQGDRERERERTRDGDSERDRKTQRPKTAAKTSVLTTAQTLAAKATPMFDLHADVDDKFDVTRRNFIYVNYV